MGPIIHMGPIRPMGHMTYEDFKVLCSPGWSTTSRRRSDSLARIVLGGALENP